MADSPDQLRIVRLAVENVMGVKAVEVTPDPDGSLVIVGGSNGQGKSSLLQAIALALGGSAAARQVDRPIREGETEAEVVVDLGDLTVTRTWKMIDGVAKASLVVRGIGGGKIGSPQALLDSLMGRLSFDPLTFLRLHPKDQVAELLALIDVPFDPEGLAAERAGLYEERTEIGRTVKSLQGQLDGLGEPDPSTPDEMVDVAALTADFARLTAEIAQNDTARNRADTAKVREDDQRAMVDRLRRELIEAETVLAECVSARLAAVEFAESLTDPDLSGIRAALDGANDTNAAVAAKLARQEVVAKLSDAESSYQARTAGIAAIDQTRAEGLAQAVMPVVGLGINDDPTAPVLLYQGVPLRDCSSAEQLKVSIGMAMAANPTVRVIRVTDGSLLDQNNLAVIEAMAAGKGYQVWVERVGDGDEGAVVIEAGEIRA